MKKILLLIIISGLLISIKAQEVSPQFTGILNIDSKEMLENTITNNFVMPDEVLPGKKSPFLAGAMSFIIPGSGEIYTGNYLKATLFVAAEVTLIYMRSHYNNKGDDKTTEFENYANQKWSAVRYAEWSMKKFGLYDEWHDKVIDSSQPQGVNWDKLNAMEDVISATDAGKYYSHKLAPFSDQQYYEMIGKYTQFVAGWEDFSNPDWNYGDGITENFREYKGMRGSANDYYNKASTLMAVIVVNHVISGIDAILSANSYNKKIELKANLANRNFGFRNVYYPEINLRLSI
ncbi:MAG: hypothetical protein ACEPO8_08860 [Rhodothermaceae bacterium]